MGWSSSCHCGGLFVAIFCCREYKYKPSRKHAKQNKKHGRHGKKSTDKYEKKEDKYDEKE